MTSRSTEYRRRKGLSQVCFDIDPSLWPELMEFTGATTKRGVVEHVLRLSIAASKREDEQNVRRALAAGRSDQD